MNSNHNYSKLIYQTEYGTSEKNQISEMENNTQHQYCLTNQEKSNKQKRLDFISDKNKLILKSYFDHKGAKEFLLKKNEVLERIDLDISIENEENQKNESSSKHKNKVRKKETHKSPKHRHKMKTLNKESTKESFGNTSPTKKKKNKYISSLNIHKFSINGPKERNKNEQESTGANKILGTMTQAESLVPKCKNKIKIGAKNSAIKIKNKLDVNMINNTKLSFNSECSVGSKIFKNKKEYEKF